MKKFIQIIKREIKELANKPKCFIDCEYISDEIGLNTERPDTLEDRIELIQIASIKVDEENKIIDKFEKYITPTYFTKERGNYDGFYDITKIKYEEIIDKAEPLEKVIKDLKEFINDLPVIIMKGDAGVIFNDTSKRLSEPHYLDKTNDVYILCRYLEEMFKIMNIEINKTTLSTCSGNLHKLLEKPMENDNTHNALHDVTSMNEFFKVYSDKVNIKKFIPIIKREIKDLIRKTKCFIDCEYISDKIEKNGPRPHTLDDNIELIQIASIKVDKDCNIIEEFNRYIIPSHFTKERGNYDGFHDITKIKYEEIMDKAEPLEKVIKDLKEFINDLPVIIMRGDAEVIFNDTSKRLSEPYYINENNNVYLFYRYMEEMFKVMNIEINKENLKTNSENLPKLLDKSVSIDDIHSASRNIINMNEFFKVYTNKVNIDL